MAEVILMPKLSNDMTEGLIAEWHKNIGDIVKKGDLLAEIEADKSTMELESHINGTLLYIGSELGDKLQIGHLLAVIGESGEDINGLLSKYGQSLATVREREKKRQELEIKFQNRKKELLYELDKNEDGAIDVIKEDDFMKILSENQSEIIKINRSYIQSFVKVANYLKIKRRNIQTFFQSLKETSNEKEFESKQEALNNQIYSYHLLLFHSISMLTSLLEDNMIVFYEIYEAFDKLSIFNTNWENEVANKLLNIDNKLDDLIIAINRVEQSVFEGLDNLSYVTQKSFNSFQGIMDEYFESIESSIRVNNLLSLIQVYQLHNVNKDIKRLA